MPKLTETARSTIRLARMKTIDNAWHLLQTAIDLFEREHYPPACFLGMTTIEEAGKLPIFQLMQGDALRVLGVGPDHLSLPSGKDLRKFTRSHLDKALQAAAWSLYINAGADRRHGIHPTSQMHRTSGVILLARSGLWMVIRNGCMYSEIDLASDLARAPSDLITREHAYYFICMAFEVLAEQATSGLGNSFESTDEETIKFWQNVLADVVQPSEQQIGTGNVRELIERLQAAYWSSVDTSCMDVSMRFWVDRMDDLRRFMERWSDTVCLDQLDFLANPEPLRKEAKRREVERRD